MSLLPCPFCGSPAKESYDEHNREHWVLCSDDSCEIAPVAASPVQSDVRRMWNTRHKYVDDAAKYRWLRKHAWDLILLPAAVADPDREQQYAKSASELDEALDAAIARHPCENCSSPKEKS